MDSISPGPLSRCTSMAADIMVSVNPVAFWNNGCIGPKVKQEITEGTEKKGLCYLRYLLFKSRSEKTCRPCAVSKAGEAGFGVAEVIKPRPHAVHDRQIEAAELAVVVALVRVVEHAAGFERAAQASGQKHGHLGRVVLAAGPHAGDEQETGIVEHRAIAFGHRVETAGEAGQLAAIVAGNPLIGIGLVVVRRRVVRCPNVQERIEKTGKIPAK